MNDKWLNGLTPKGIQATVAREIQVRDERIWVLEAKLEKALDMALESCPFYWGSGSHNDWWQERRATVAALKGEK